MKNQDTITETSSKQKRRFFLFLSIYSFGYILLLFIGDTINEDGFTLLSFLAPFTVLIGVIGITVSLVKK